MNSHPLASARSFLFVPANRPERFAKAIESGADAVIIDLEDSVPSQEKDAARDTVCKALPSLPAQAYVVVRINSPETHAGQQDVQALEDAMARLDLKHLANLAHKLKSSAQMMQSEALLRLCETLEQALADNATAGTLSQLCNQLRELMDKLNTTLAASAHPH